MNDLERQRSKEIWERMTDAERQQAEEERAAILKWWQEEDKKAMEKIELEGRYSGGLDGEYPELLEISKEANRRLNALLHKLFAEKK